MGNFLSSSRHKGLELFSWKIRIQKPENVMFASISPQITGFTNQWPWPYGPTALWPTLELFITNKLSTILTMYSIRIRLKIATKDGLKFMEKILVQLVRNFSK